MKIDLEDALARLAEMRYEDSDEGVANAQVRVGVAYLQRERWPQAAEALDEAHYLCGKLENPVGQAQVALRLAEALAGLGRLEEAVGLLNGAWEAFVAADDLKGRLGVLERRAGVRQRLGQPEEAIADYLAALDLVRAQGDEISELLLVQYLAPLLRETGQWPAAVETYRRLGVLADRFSDPQRVALALTGLGACYQETGRLDLAWEALAQARDTFQSLGMLEWVRRLEGQLTVLDAARRAPAAD
ncbi:MAG: hypothetical protein KQJ78_12885 [Deltaproteobacteria bacterium]|nr:hypothetical protein [Deltaproteobacteria bacterium]